MQIVELNDLQDLLAALMTQGYTVIGPKIRDGAISFDTVERVEEFPRGWTDVQDAGTYRIAPGADDSLFMFTVGPHSWKRYLFPSRLRLFAARKEGKGFAVEPEDAVPARPFAFIGVRACELAALAIQDKIFMSGAYRDRHYAQTRSSAFIVAVNCAQAGGTCFCASMGTGPRAREGFDLALTEVREGTRHYFVVEMGSDRGREVLEHVTHRPAEKEEAERAAAVARRTTAAMGRTLETKGLAGILRDNFEHPRWDDISKRCLSCANCTMVCPTCFCSTVEDLTDLTGDHAERWRRWDSCFTADFTRVAGGNIRMSTRTRYRQWLTHKLSNWVEQFGTSGCVGCGRCITWCPVGIDITAEATAIRESTIATTNG
ncbi:MAG: 4Fe-4S dicluster domain-containing protein [Ignavibacteriae bacterium]|nr:4Fe-4S dicluster domain-containing protein [Ignavibacteriota bacterium]